MSIRIALDNAPEFYTNLDPVAGRVILHLTRPEGIGAVIVKLEGESKTALQNSFDAQSGPGNLAAENHKVLYKVQQVFPDEGTGPYVLQPGQYEYPFRFKIPFNNACSDVVAMSKLGGLAGIGGFGSSGGGIFGSGIRVMDGSRQVFLQHVKKTLPPSLTGFPGKAEIKYYIKVTLQRPGLLKENWRYQIGFRFMPFEEPRPKRTTAEMFARRPFAFRPRSPAPNDKRRTSFFGIKHKDQDDGEVLPPTVEMSALLPYPSILTCNSPIPLKLSAKKKLPSNQEVFLTALQIDLVGKTSIRAHDVKEQPVNRWIVVTNTNLQVPLTKTPEDEVGTEVMVPDELWRNAPLPNTVCPSFVTCNLSRTYELEIKLAVSWGKPPRGLRAGKDNIMPQTIHLPLHFSDVKVFSGIKPPPEILNAAMNRPSSTTNPSNSNTNQTTTNPNNQIPVRVPVPNSNPPSSSNPPQQQQQPGPRPRPPQLPPRRDTTPTNVSATPMPPARPVYDPLYPPQLGSADSHLYDDAPPSYDEAMAEIASVPADGMRPRPAYSGVTTDVNGPSQIPERQ